MYTFRPSPTVVMVTGLYSVMNESTSELRYSTAVPVKCSSPSACFSYLGPPGSHENGMPLKLLVTKAMGTPGCSSPLVIHVVLLGLGFGAGCRPAPSGAGY